MDEIGDGYMRAWRKGANSAFFRCTVAQAGQGVGGGGGGGGEQVEALTETSASTDVKTRQSPFSVCYNTVLKKTRLWYSKIQIENGKLPTSKTSVTFLFLRIQCVLCQL